MTSLDQLLEFLKLIHRFQAIERKIAVPGQERNENDAEHSFALALCTWYLIDSRGLKLDSIKAVKYALVHDLLELYTGDVAYFESAEKVLQKKEKEREALTQITEALPDWPALVDLIKAYEDKTDPESRFVYVLDKLLPAANNYLDNGRTWKKYGLKFETIVAQKLKFIDLAPELEADFKSLLGLIEKDQGRLFRAD